MKIADKKSSKSTRTKKSFDLKKALLKAKAAQAKKTTKPSQAKDRAKLSGEKDEPKSGRVSSILSGLKSSFGSAAEGTDESEGLLDKVGGVVGGAKDFIFGGDDKSNTLAEDRDKDATVAVIDYFADEGEEAKHGDKVESIIQDNSDLKDEDIQRYQASGGGNINDVVDADTDELGDALDGYIEDRVTGLIDGSSEAYEDILSQDDSKIRTVNQSLGAPEIRIAQDLHRKLEDDEAFKERFLEYAGLDSGASDKELLQALVGEVSDSRRNNEAIAESQERYDALTKEAKERGITTVVSAGNYGRFADLLEKEGVKADDEFYNDVLVNDNVIAVGATDSQGTSRVSDDEAAELTTPRAGTDLSANGVDVETTVDGVTSSGSGTSFAAPQVAAAAARLAEAHPEFSPAMIEQILERSANNPDLDSSEVGAGVLQVDNALKLADKVDAILGALAA